MSQLVVVVPLNEGAREDARRLLRDGPPFDLEATRFESHQVYLTASEAIFVFDAPGAPATLELGAEGPSLWNLARAWKQLMAGAPRVAETAYSWKRVKTRDGVFWEATAGPGDSEGGDIYSP
jgi:hypothetical protein